MALGPFFLVFTLTALGVFRPSPDGLVAGTSFNVRDLVENGSGQYIFCYSKKAHLNNTVTWTLTTLSNKNVSLGTCERLADECTSTHPGYDLTIDDYFYYVYVHNVSREMGKQVTCSLRTQDNGTVSKALQLNVYRPPLLDSCSLDILQHNWSVVISCEVTRAFSTAGVYTLQVMEGYSENATYPRWQWESRYEWDKVSFGQSLTAYTNSTDHREYYRGRVVHSWTVALQPTNTWMANIFLCCGTFRSSCASFQHVMSDIVPPPRPTLYCRKGRYVAEKERSWCVCIARFLGRPRGRLVWKRDGHTIAESSSRRLNLPKLRHNRDRVNQQVSCQVDWIRPTYAFPVFNVAYGPDSVQIFVSPDDPADPKGEVTVSCVVTGMMPRTSDMVQWAGLCQGQRGDTCTLHPREEDVYGRNVSCSVTNAANGGHSAEAVAVIRGGQHQPGGQEGQGVKWAAAGGAVMTGILVLTALSVLMLVRAARQGCPCWKRVYSSTQSQSAQQAEDAHQYEAIRPVAAPSRDNNRNNNRDNNRSRDNPPRTEASGGGGGRGTPRADAVYENACFDEDPRVLP